MVRVCWDERQQAIAGRLREKSRSRAFTLQYSARPELRPVYKSLHKFFPIARYQLESIGGGGEGRGMELTVCPSVSVSPLSSVGAVWEGGFAFKVQIFFAILEGERMRALLCF
jgi:hypothetical protein